MLISVSAIAAFATPAPAAVATQYTSVNPERLVDTREGIGAPEAKVEGGAEITVDVAEVGSVPADAGAVVMNVTVTAPETAGFITVYPGDVAELDRPVTSSLNFAQGQTAGNLVIAKLGAGGDVKMYNGGGGDTHIIADVAGYFPSGSDIDYNGLTPSRLLDTRDGTGVTEAGAVEGDSEIVLDVTTGGDAVPETGASAVILNVTVTNTETAGYITAYPGDVLSDDRPTTSSLNFDQGKTIGSLVIATVGADGDVKLYNGGGGSVDIIADVAGWFTTAPEGDDYEGLTPERALDTRNATGVLTTTPLASGGTIELDVTTSANVDDDASSVVITLVVTQPKRAGYVTVYPTGETEPPTASSLNFAAGETRANLVIAKVGDDGKVSIFNGSGSTVHLVADIAGFFPAHEAEPEL